LLLTNLISLAAPLVLKYAVDSLKQGINSRLLWLYAGLILLVALLQGVCRFFMRWLLIGVSRHLEYELRNRLFAHLQRLSYGYFARARIGDLMSRLTNDLNTVRMFLGPGVMHFSSGLILFLAASGLMFYLDWRLALLALLPLPLLSFLMRGLTQRLYLYSEEVQAQLARLNSMLQEHFSGMRVIKAYVRERFEQMKFARLNQEYLGRNLRLAKVHSAFLPLFILALGLDGVIVLLVGGQRVIAGAISLGDFVAFNGYLLLLAFPMMALGWVINLYQRGQASMERLNRLLAEEAKIKDDEYTRPELADYPFIGGLELRNLRFAYPGEKGRGVEVLRGIDLQVAPGEILGLIGPVGAGKTTLVNLILRVLEPEPGQIFIDGVDVREIPLATLRRLIAYVPQEGFLFSETIRENIGFALAEEDFGRVVQAAEIADIASFVEAFPKKYDTLLGERGVNLSGGQRQRVALARALAAEPRILILDDTFANMDSRTEERILERLRVSLAGRTCIIISHRLSSLRYAQRIAVLEAGRIVRCTTPAELGLWRSG